jgi:hypothetical protein
MSSNVLSSELERLLACWLALDEALDEDTEASKGLWVYIEDGPDLAAQTRAALGLEQGQAVAEWAKVFAFTKPEPSKISNAA